MEFKSILTGAPFGSTMQPFLDALLFHNYLTPTQVGKTDEFKHLDPFWLFFFLSLLLSLKEAFLKIMPSAATLKLSCYTGYPKRLCSLHPWRFSQCSWINPWVTSADLTADPALSRSLDLTSSRSRFRRGLSCECGSSYWGIPSLFHQFCSFPISFPCASATLLTTLFKHHSSFKKHDRTQMEQIQKFAHAATSLRRTLLVQRNTKTLLTDTSFILISKSPVSLGEFLSVTGEARTQIHVPSSWIALFIPFAAS